MKLFDLVYDDIEQMYALILGDIKNYNDGELVVSDMEMTMYDPYALYFINNNFVIKRMFHFDFRVCEYNSMENYLEFSNFYYFIRKRAKCDLNDCSLILEKLENVNKNNKDIYLKFLRYNIKELSVTTSTELKPNKLYLLYDSSNALFKYFVYYGEAYCKLPDNSYKEFVSSNYIKYKQDLFNLVQSANKYGTSQELLYEYEKLENTFKQIPVANNKIIYNKLFSIGSIEDFNPLYTDYSIDSMIQNNALFKFYNVMFYKVKSLKIYELGDIYTPNPCYISQKQVVIDDRHNEQYFYHCFREENFKLEFRF